MPLVVAPTIQNLSFFFLKEEPRDFYWFTGVSRALCMGLWCLKVRFESRVMDPTGNSGDFYCHICWYPWLQSSDGNFLPWGQLEGPPQSLATIWKPVAYSDPRVLQPEESSLMIQQLALVPSRFERLVLVGAFFGSVPRLVADDAL